jgi:hypothetical protein
MSARRITTHDLSTEEQRHVRNALTFFRAKLGTWKAVARMLRFEPTTVVNVKNARRTATASMAIRIARLADVEVEAVLTGEFPPHGVCPRCGYKEIVGRDSQSAHGLLRGISNDRLAHIRKALSAKLLERAPHMRLVRTVGNAANDEKRTP